MDDETSGEKGNPDPEPRDAGWLPLVAGVLGLAAGAALGAVVGLKDGPDAAFKLAAIGGFIGMVLAVVPATSRIGSDHADDHPSGDGGSPGQRPPVLSRRTSSRAAARVPDGGLPTRSVPNQNADLTGRVEGGTLVRVIRRSGNWARIQTADQEEAIWVERHRLQPTDAPLPDPDPD